MRNTQLPDELKHWRDRIEKIASDYGLDFYTVIFEILDWKEINEVASYGGFPNRYPHWRFGMEYEQLSKSYAYGLSKIYEMVINNDPCYAYLLHSNSLMDQKLVMAHVYGHCDFFKNNIFFAHTNRQMMDGMANHKTRVMRYIDKYGYEPVEAFIDVCLSLDNLIDIYGPLIKRHDTGSIAKEAPDDDVARLKTDRSYLTHFINPKDFLDEQREKASKKNENQKLTFPLEPWRDVMAFLINYAPIEEWQRDVLTIIRDEAYYFAPQGQTKIMNEGWASYWHSKMMTNKIMDDSEVIDFADHHSGTVAMSGGRLNPYKIGIEIYRDIEERWNKGRFGLEYDMCDNMVEKKKWDKNLGLGREKIFEVRKIYNDVTFIDTFLTPEFCAQHKMFSFDYNLSKKTYEIASREFGVIKQKLLQQLTNFGQPVIEVVDANHSNRSELLLKHRYDGAGLRTDYIKEVLQNLYVVWKRPVLIDTQTGDRHRLFRFDGKEHTESDSKDGI
ncbi:SpoVR family protein [bacterium]|nr:SpoVR family protein [bacterium]